MTRRKRLRATVVDVAEATPIEPTPGNPYGFTTVHVPAHRVLVQDEIDGVPVSAPYVATCLPFTVIRGRVTV